MTVICSQCHKPAPPSAQYCARCGATLGGTQVQGRTVLAPQFPRPAALDLPLDPFHPAALRTLRGAVAGPPVLARSIAEWLVLVLDRSDSMGEPYDGERCKLDAARRAAAALILRMARLDPQGQLGVVEFNGSARVLAPLCPVQAHKQSLIDTLQSLTPDNGTDLDAGLREARQLLSGAGQQVPQRIVLLTDGQGGDPRATAADLKRRGVVLDMIGIGDCPDHVNEKLLRTIATTDASGPHYRFIKDEATLIKTFTQLANRNGPF